MICLCIPLPENHLPNRLEPGYTPSRFELFGYFDLGGAKNEKKSPVIRRDIRIAPLIGLPLDNV
jgi:hypothetical protein